MCHNKTENYNFGYKNVSLNLKLEPMFFFPSISFIPLFSYLIYETQKQ
jgi:hypothetical protein